jgi:hypothetical protein
MATAATGKRSRGRSNIKWTSRADIKLAEMYVDDFSKWCTSGQKLAIARGWASKIGLSEQDPKGNKTKMHIDAMIGVWKKTYEWTHETGRGSIWEGGREISVEEQAERMCPYYSTWYDLMSTQENIKSTSVLNEGGLNQNIDDPMDPQSSEPTDDNDEEISWPESEEDGNFQPKKQCLSDNAVSTRSNLGTQESEQPEGKIIPSNN